MSEKEKRAAKKSVAKRSVAKKPGTKKSGTHPLTDVRRHTFHLEVDGRTIDINFDISYNTVSIGRPRPPIPQGQQRVIVWSMHPVGIDQVGTLEIIEHGPRI